MSIEEPEPIPLYRDQPEWKDVQPIYNSERENAVIKIAASEEFIDAFAYLRAVMSKNEMSERALELTKTCTMLNAANYSVWQYRRNILKALNKDIAEELRFCEEMAAENPKNYQIWHHRRMLVLMSNDYSQELEFTTIQLEDDSKNYHAWQYRQWVIQNFDLFSVEEVKFATVCLAQDLRNNSAWNYRYFIVSKLSDGFKDKEYLENEVRFTLGAIKTIPNNESSWSYLAGILINEGLTKRQDVNDFCASLLTQQPPIKSTHLRNFVIDQLAERIEQRDNVEDCVKQAHLILAELEEQDPIRTKYWQYRKTYLDNLAAFT
ncbi:protein prenyltransferase alpha subunit repeat domain-containing protein [Ditylenchus destructor]|uniref:Protein farnesyltransferase/geranylgeranyltransferase type-1 subunit alpha n=1 Tax=Ditylenchus destructor TaxID=166010 RepID=A0AAD4MSH0_9BILA|nr:protein prenyltransferase alpha subunit repeat domain-containing protein [Ditylenchus destructor]